MINRAVYVINPAIYVIDPANFVIDPAIVVQACNNLPESGVCDERTWLALLGPEAQPSDLEVRNTTSHWLQSGLRVYTRVFLGRGWSQTLNQPCDLEGRITLPEQGTPKPFRLNPHGCHCWAMMHNQATLRQRRGDVTKTHNHAMA